MDSKLFVFMIWLINLSGPTIEHFPSNVYPASVGYRTTLSVQMNALDFDGVLRRAYELDRKLSVDNV